MPFIFYSIRAGRKINALHARSSYVASERRYCNGQHLGSIIFIFLASPFFFPHERARHRLSRRMENICARLRTFEKDRKRKRENICEMSPRRRSDISVTSRRYTLADLFHDTSQVLTMRVYKTALSLSLSLRYTRYLALEYDSNLDGSNAGRRATNQLVVSKSFPLVARVYGRSTAKVRRSRSLHRIDVRSLPRD